MKTQQYPFSQELFDEQYYGKRARGGFGADFDWNHPEQQSQLGMKLNHIKATGDFKSILFVGCARGWEVRYFYAVGKQPWGVEVSKWAVDHCDITCKDRVHLYDGCHLIGFTDRNVDVVAAFDVMTLVPDSMLHKLASEMRRVARDRIVFRTLVRLSKRDSDEWHGNDGVTYRYLWWHDWVDLFQQDGFKLLAATTEPNTQTVFTFNRVK